MENAFKPLFESMKIGNVEIKNKFFMAPMATTVMSDENQCYTPQSVEYYVERAKGGVGLIITGANWVDNDVEPHAPSSFPCPNKMPNLYTKMAREMTDRVHAYDTKIFLQLTAGLGRSALPNFVAPQNFVAPSKTTNRWLPNVECRELKTEEIEKIVKDFGSAALIAKEAGFDGVEIHAVHEGYLLDCFTMSLFNQRTDKYGGDLKGRLTFATEIVQEIKNKCGQDFPVVLRFSIKSYIRALRQGGLPGEKFEELGRDVDEAIEAIKILQDAGYDAFDADAGTYDSWYWAHPPMYFEKGMYLPLARQIQGVSKVPVMVAGRMDDPQMAVNALNEGIIDAVGLGRPLLTDPDYVNKLKTGHEQDIRPCLGCHDGCFGRLLQHGLGSAVNPECGREFLVGIKKAETKKNVVVIGGGPGGMEAARVSAMRGHKVTLFEAKDRLGGALNIAGVPDFKEDDRALVAWYTKQLEDLNVDVRLNTTATKEIIDELHPDAVFVGEGSTPAIPKIPGVENAPLPPMNEFMLRDLLAFNDVKIKTNEQVTEIKADSVVLNDETIACNQVVLAIGYRSKHSLFDQIKYDYPEVFNVGDSRDVRNIRGAIWDSYEIARNL